MPFDGVEIPGVTERLIIGRARIEAGWCRNHLHRSKWTLYGRRDHYCLLGSMMYTDLPPLGWATNERIELLLTAAIEQLGYGHRAPHEFNDEVGRTNVQVLDVIELAIAMSCGAYSVHAMPVFLRRKVA